MLSSIIFPTCAEDSLSFGINFILEYASLFFVLIGGLFALYKWSMAQNIKRANFVQQLYEKLRENTDIIEANRMIDYETPVDIWYSKDYNGFKDKKVENIIDNYFSWLSYICYIKSKRCISNKEFHLFEYSIMRVIRSYSSKTYLWNLYHFSQKNNVPFVYLPLLEYGFKKKLINKKDFKDRAKELYPVVLNI